MSFVVNQVYCLLIPESRSSSACSQTAGTTTGVQSQIPSQFGDNPVFMKFLMSQRQSDLSSVGGFSNVETGSQPDLERRGSLNSNESERILVSEQATVQKNRTLFSQSIDALSGSTDTITSSQGVTAAYSPKTSGEFQDIANTSKVQPEPTESINSNNSVSFLNRPLDKVGFVTLEALMKGDTDIGKLLNRSLESIEKGTIPAGASPLHKQDGNMGAPGAQSMNAKPKGVRERRDSSFSISSDGGSDSEKRKVSMKYMGTLPEGMDCETFVRQMSEENKNKSLMFTVFTSPEANTQLRRTPDSGLRAPTVSKQVDRLTLPEYEYKSDTNSTKTLTDTNELNESQSARSTYSLGEQIKRMCDGQNVTGNQKLEMQTPRSGSEAVDDLTPRASNEKHDSGIKLDGVLLENLKKTCSPIKECSVVLQDCSPVKPGQDFNIPAKWDSPKTVVQDTGSPVRKRLKSKKERDQMSRRKQKESFILQSDTNSESENVNMSPSQRAKVSLRFTTRSEEELLLSGSEDVTPRPAVVAEGRKSLLDEVQLETPSDSCEDRTRKSAVSVTRYAASSIKCFSCSDEVQGGNTGLLLWLVSLVHEKKFAVESYFHNLDGSKTWYT